MCTGGPVASQVEVAAMRRALALAATPGVPTGPNPRVGCVLVGVDGTPVAEGHHRGAGSPHAEVDALARAGSAARGTTAVVTLEPCRHAGRTGPCTEALLGAGVARVVFGQADSNPVAAGGAARLREAGVSVEGGLLADQARALNPWWTFAVEHQRPFVTWKAATSLDGRVAAADGSSRWITSAAARTQVHALRSDVDAVVVGTGTVLADDPSLTVRDAAGVITGPQPLRVVVGERDLPATSRVLDGTAPHVQLRMHDVGEVLSSLFSRDVQHVLLEGGPTLAGGFLEAGAVDRVVAYVAPRILGNGPAMVELPGSATLADSVELDVESVTQVGPDVCITLTPRAREAS
ncbi:MAG TPA: bifunctional diaminohydroxyphosphoribosylaminopyrimidine deaminase/5-amino-6-(5-phosphoribosylamino)uracil reductase RibD [Actinomycetes bacterium]|nr:bifunctional diaminohydroxyphosphoribosylaminopyrimidine deaminase/5-amino-6-(5-phosphoribosylamino)uracil reductase RibD [Actinomycetes bacterium]